MLSAQPGWTGWARLQCPLAGQGDPRGCRPSHGGRSASPLSPDSQREETVKKRCQLLTHRPTLGWPVRESQLLSQALRTVQLLSETRCGFRLQNERRPPAPAAMGFCRIRLARQKLMKGIPTSSALPWPPAKRQRGRFLLSQAPALFLPHQAGNARARRLGSVWGPCRAGPERDFLFLRCSGWAACVASLQTLCPLRQLFLLWKGLFTSLTRGTPDASSRDQLLAVGPAGHRGDSHPAAPQLVGCFRVLWDCGSRVLWLLGCALPWVSP